MAEAPRRRQVLLATKDARNHLVTLTRAVALVTRRTRHRKNEAASRLGLPKSQLKRTAYEELSLANVGLPCMKNDTSLHDIALLRALLADKDKRLNALEEEVCHLRQSLGDSESTVHTLRQSLDDSESTVHTLRQSLSDSEFTI